MTDSQDRNAKTKDSKAAGLDRRGFLQLGGAAAAVAAVAAAPAVASSRARGTKAVATPEQIRTSLSDAKDMKGGWFAV